MRCARKFARDTHWLCAAWFVMLALASVAQGGDVADWKRHPLTTVPYMTEPPSIDGDVKREEWQRAATLGPLMILPDGVSDELRRRVWVGYDQKQIYIAFDIERPEHVRKPLVPANTGRIDKWGKGDFIELMLDTGHDHKEYYDFNLYANGAYSDGHGNPSVDTSWDADWRQAARMTEEGWQGETAIPFNELGLDDAPAPGTVWGFDFVDNQRTPFAQVALYAFRGPSWHKFENFGHLRFGARQPAEPVVRFMRAREAGRGKAVVEFSVVNPTGASRDIDADVTLLRRKDGAAGGPKSYYDHIESGSDDAYDKGLVDFEKTTTLDSLVKEALNLYAPVENAATKKTVTVPAGQRRTVGFAQAIDPGEFLVVYQFDDAEDTRLASGVRAFRITAPLSLTLEPYWLHSKKMNAIADLRKVTQPDGATVKFTLHHTEKETGALAQAQTTVKANALEAGVSLPTKGLAPGFYEVRAELIGNDGQTITRSRKPIEKPETPAWHDNDYGRRVKVPEPWTPIEAGEDGIVKMWGRTYDLSTLLPKQITSQGEALLTSPVALNLKRDGETVDWRVTELELVRADKGEAVYRGTLESDVATLTGTVRVEFDGFMWYDLKLKPKSTPLRAQHMALAIDFTPRHATLMNSHKFLRDPVLSRKPVKPAKRGPRGILAESLLPFTPSLWIGDENAGLAWIAEAPIDWHISQPDRVIEVQPAGKNGSDAPARMRMHMIQSPKTLKKPMRVIFGLQASPARPMPDVGASHIAQAGGPHGKESWYKSLSEHAGEGVVFHSGWKGKPKQKIWGGWPERPPQPKRRKRLKESVNFAHKHGLKVSLYSGWGVATDSEEWKYFRHEMARKPLENAGFGTYRQAAGPQGAYQDYITWAFADLIKEYDIDGVFWDSASNLRAGNNIGIGNGWIDDKGRKRPGFAVLGTRELFKRIYTLVHGEMKSDGQVINFGGSIWCINVFADVFHRGEGTPMHAQKLRNAWKPLETYRANYDGRKFGIASLAMNKNFKDLDMTVNTHHAVTLLHGWHCKSSGYFTKPWGMKRSYYGRGHEPMFRIWEARAWLPLDRAAERHTFYRDGPRYIDLQPESLLASAFTSADGRRMLLVVSNLDKKPIEDATVQLDLQGLGLTGGAPVKVTDAILGEPVEIQGDTLKIDIKPERFRLLQLERSGP